MEGHGLGLHARLGALANFASFDISFYVLLHLGPPVFPKYKLLCLFNPWVSSKDVIVALGDDLASE